MADDKNVPVSPVKPRSMEMIYLYPCPFCEREVPMLSPTVPQMAQCDACRRTFPIVPVDEKTIKFIKVVLANGQASIDPDFV